VETTLTDEQSELLTRLEEKNLRERARRTDQSELVEQTKQDLARFSAGFDPDRIKRIDGLCGSLMLFIDFVHFDYYYLLKKFDSNIVENNFSYKPYFESIRGEYVLDELKELNDLVLGLDENTDWDKIMEILHTYRKVEFVRRNIWKKAAGKLTAIKRAGLFELMIKHISGDPFYKSRPVEYHETIVEQYIASLKTDVGVSLQKISKESRSKKIEGLAQMLFGNTPEPAMENYNERANLIFRKNGMPGFAYVERLDYIRAFLAGYFKTDISAVLDLLLIKGRWSSNDESQTLSDGYHQLIRLYDDLLEFDESLGEEEDAGRRLRNLFYRSEKDKNVLPVIRRELQEINEKARGFIVSSAQNLVSVGKSIKNVYEDYSNKPHELIVNWREVESSTDGKVKDRLMSVYKKIYYFIQLLQSMNRSRADQEKRD